MKLKMFSQRKILYILHGVYKYIFSLSCDLNTTSIEHDFMQNKASSQVIKCLPRIELKSLYLNASAKCMIVNVHQPVLHSLLHFLQAAGMMVYYILSGGKHHCDTQNDELDIEAQDLIDWMINKQPAIDKVLKHPYFWDKKR